MTRLLRHILLTVFFSLPLSAAIDAEEIHIRVIALQYEKDLWYVKFKLDELGYPTHVTYKDRKYLVYAGPFKNRSSAENALKRIKQRISRHAVIIGSSSAAGSENKKAEKPSQPQTETGMTAQKTEEPTPDKSGYFSFFEKEKLFLGLSIGHCAVDIEQHQKSGSIVLDADTKDSGIAYGLEAGYSVDDAIFVTLNYRRSYLENVDLDDFYATVNYRFGTVLSALPYAGAMAGYSVLSWEKNITDVSTNDDSVGTSFIGGVQAGLEFDAIGYMSVYAACQYWLMDHTAEVAMLTGKIELKHVSQQNVLLGVKYRF